MQPTAAHDYVRHLGYRRVLVQSGIVSVAHLLEHAAELAGGHAVEVHREGVQEPRIGRLVVLAVPRHRGHVHGCVLGD